MLLVGAVFFFFATDKLVAFIMFVQWVVSSVFCHLTQLMPYSAYYMIHTLPLLVGAGANSQVVQFL